MVIFVGFIGNVLCKGIFADTDVRIDYMHVFVNRNEGGKLDMVFHLVFNWINFVFRLRL